MWYVLNSYGEIVCGYRTESEARKMAMQIGGDYRYSFGENIFQEGEQT